MMIDPTVGAFLGGVVFAAFVVFIVKKVNDAKEKKNDSFTIGGGGKNPDQPPTRKK